MAASSTGDWGAPLVSSTTMPPPMYIPMSSMGSVSGDSLAGAGAVFCAGPGVLSLPFLKNGRATGYVRARRSEKRGRILSPTPRRSNPEAPGKQGGCGERDDDRRAGRPVMQRGRGQSCRVRERTERPSDEQSGARRRAAHRQCGQDQAGKHQIHADELDRGGDGERENQVEAEPSETLAAQPPESEQRDVDRRDLDQLGRA